MRSRRTGSRSIRALPPTLPPAISTCARRRRRARSEFSGARARARALSQRPRAARRAGSRGAGGRLTSAKAPPARDVTTLIQWSSAWPANACAGGVRRRRGRAWSRAGRRGENPGRAGQTRRGTSVRMSAMPQARPSLLGPRSTRKVQPVQSSRASFLWLFSSVAIPAEGRAVRGKRVMGARGRGGVFGPPPARSTRSSAPTFARRAAAPRGRRARHEALSGRGAWRRGRGAARGRGNAVPSSML